MNEQEWLSSADPSAMLLHVSPNASDRRLRLFACACCRHAYNKQPMLSDDFNLNIAEEKGHPALSDIEWATNWAQTEEHNGASKARAALLRCIFGNPFLLIKKTQCKECFGDGTNPMPDEGAIFGCGFCKGTGKQFPWLTPSAVSLAESIYQSREWDGLPVLADAMEEAGCQEQEMLRHLRGEVEQVCGRCDGDGKAHGSDRPFEWSADVEYGKCVVCKGSGTTGWRRVENPVHARGCHVVDAILVRS